MKKVSWKKARGTQVLNWFRYLGQVLAYGLFILLIGYLSNSPGYVHLQPDQATIKVSVRHSGRRCTYPRNRTEEELSQLPANMRVVQVCPRERSPLLLELELDNTLVVSEKIEPGGLHNDGRASAYSRFSVPSGKVVLKVRMKDHLSQENFPYRLEQTIVLKPAQVLVIDFDSLNQRFSLL